MKVLEVQIINAFVDQEKGGNPAGVVLDADAYTQKEKLAIASKVGLSETAFVSKSTIADFKLDFFTPNRQIAHCGHATIATFSYLSQLGKVANENSSKETVDGPREILLKDGLAFMEQKAPIYKDVSSRKERILQSLSLHVSDLIEELPIQVVNTGNSFLIIPVKDAKTLAALTPDFSMINEISEEFDLIGYYVFTTETNDPTRDADTRMFGPRYDIKEEAGTGMAAGPLACYLYDIKGDKKRQFLIRQGKYMKKPSPSLIVVNIALDGDKITKIMAGGKGIVTKKIIVEI